MGKTLILAEKKSVGTYIAHHLNASGQGNGSTYTNEYIIAWAEGHLVGLAEPQDQDLSWGGTWNFDVLPMVPRPFKLKVLRKKEHAFKAVSEAMMSSNVDRILVATDADREGELIFRYIYHYLGCTKPFDRLVLTSNTPAAITAAFADIRPGQDFNALAAAAWARSNADWLVGFNGTRAMTVAAGNSDVISVGRVQTPTLVMCVQRKAEIDRFVATTFWMVEGLFVYDGEMFKGRLLEPDQDSQAKFSSEGLALEARKRCDLMKAMVIKADRTVERMAPPSLFDLTLLQREANNRFGYTAKKTHELAEELYDKHQAITYPRTDTCYLDEKVFSSVMDHIMAIHVHFIAAADAALANYDPAILPRCVRNEEVTVHHAIIPSDKPIERDSLPEDLRNIYTMICERFLTNLLPDAIIHKSRVIVKTGKERFKATGSTVTEKGWMQAERRRTADDALPHMNEMDQVDIMNIEVVERETTPPSHLTDASLLSAMETAGKSLDDPDMAKLMKGKGLGTPATRDNIIEGLIAREYLARSGKKIVATEKGIKVINSLRDLGAVVPLVNTLLSPEMTATWETILANMSEAPDFSYKGMFTDFQNGIVQAVTDICEGLKSADLDIPGKEPVGACLLCGKDVVDTGKSFRCVGWRAEGGCSFSIWKNTLGGRITKTMAKEILTNGQTQKPCKLKSKAGKEYTACLKFSSEEMRVIPVFENKPVGKNEAIGPCPLCPDGRIYEREKSFGCSAWKDGCNFTIWKSKSPQGVDADAVAELLRVKTTGKEYAFDKRGGGTFMAKLAIRDGKIEQITKKTKAAAHHQGCAYYPGWF